MRAWKPNGPHPRCNPWSHRAEWMGAGLFLLDCSDGLKKAVVKIYVSPNDDETLMHSLLILILT